jgi:hypothetical protein
MNYSIAALRVWERQDEAAKFEVLAEYRANERYAVK